MADAEGPGRHAPRMCSTLTLADLGDTIGWREPGKENTIYGFRLDPKGYYSRTAIDHPDDDDWDVQLELRRGVVYTEHANMLVRLENLGKCLVSYQACKIVIKGNQGPIITTQSFLKLSAAKPLVYAVTATEIKAKTKYCMKAWCEFDADLRHLAKIPPGSTIYIELFLGPAVQADPLPVIPGVSIKWSASTHGKHIAVVINRSEGTDGKWTARSSDQDVVVSLLQEVGVDDIIIHPSYAFVRLLFSSDPVNEYRIDQLISKLKK